MSCVSTRIISIGCVRRGYDLSRWITTPEMLPLWWTSSTSAHDRSWSQVLLFNFLLDERRAKWTTDWPYWRCSHPPCSLAWWRQMNLRPFPKAALPGSTKRRVLTRKRDRKARVTSAATKKVRSTSPSGSRGSSWLSGNALPRGMKPSGGVCLVNWCNTPQGVFLTCGLLSDVYLYSQQSMLSFIYLTNSRTLVRLELIRTTATTTANSGCCVLAHLHSICYNSDINIFRYNTHVTG